MKPFRSALALASLMLAPLSAAAVDLQAGDVVVLEQFLDRVVRVRPDAYDAGNASANQVVITEGDLLEYPYDVAIGDGELFVTDRTADIIIRVDLGTGAQSVVGGANGVNVGGTPLGALDPRGIAIDAQGMLVVADTGYDTILQVDPDTGEAANLTPSIFFAGPSALEIDAQGRLLVLDVSELRRITPATQANQRIGVGASDGLAIDPVTGMVYSAGTSEIYRYDPDAYDPGNTTANRTLVFGDDGDAVGVLPDGDLVATNTNNADLLRIDPGSGVGTTAANGANLSIPSGLAVVMPEPGGGAIALLALAALRRRRRRISADL